MILISILLAIVVAAIVVKLFGILWRAALVLLVAATLLVWLEPAGTSKLIVHGRVLLAEGIRYLQHVSGS